MAERASDFRNQLVVERDQGADPGVAYFAGETARCEATDITQISCAPESECRIDRLCRFPSDAGSWGAGAEGARRCGSRPQPFLSGTAAA